VRQTVEPMQPSREGAVCRVRPELGKDRDARELADAEVALQRQAVSLAKERSGEMETTSNTTTFPGFTGHFKSKRRDAVATGTVVVNGETLVNGSTTNAEIETLEDKNISHQ
jgi:hypothetical protein